MEAALQVEVLPQRNLVRHLLQHSIQEILQPRGVTLLQVVTERDNSVTRNVSREGDKTADYFAEVTDAVELDFEGQGVEVQVLNGNLRYEVVVEVQNASHFEARVVELPVEVADVGEQGRLCDIHVRRIHFPLEVLEIESDTVVLAQNYELFRGVEAHILQIEGPQAEIEGDYVGDGDYLVVEDC